MVEMQGREGGAGSLIPRAVGLHGTKWVARRAEMEGERGIEPARCLQCSILRETAEEGLGTPGELRGSSIRLQGLSLSWHAYP